MRALFRGFRYLIFLFIMFFGFMMLLSSHSVNGNTVNNNQAMLLTIKGAISPGSADYLVRGISAANKNNNQVVVIQMDTPGGLDTSMRDIVQSINASKVPVVTYVYPSGARAASAGTFILYASHVAAMAPATNLGAASPVSIGSPSIGEASGDKKDATDSKSTMERKVFNDSIAYIRSLAEMRGRNADWAEQAVRKASSLSAQEALKRKVIDYVATDLNELMTKIDGNQVKVNGVAVTLKTQGIVITKRDADWRTQFLSVITNPSFAYIMMLVGIYGLILEFTNPGIILPGVLGAICLLLSMYAFALLPINYVGLALIALGIAFMIAEAFVTSFGVLGAGGVLAFIIGSVMLVDTKFPGFSIALWLIISVAIVTGFFVVLLVNMALRSRYRPVLSGSESMIKATGTVTSISSDRLMVRVRGELWQASTDSDLAVGDKITVLAVNGLVLTVAPSKN